MALVGYARTSTADQNPVTQQQALAAAGAERIFTDPGLSSRLSDRPQWRACLDYMRAGDVLLVYRLDRLAGSVGMLIETISELGERDIDVRSCTEPEIDTSSPMGRALWGMIAVFAQLRVDTIRQNTVDGLARARAAGRVGGRPTVQTRTAISDAHALRSAGTSVPAIARTLAVSESTVRRMLRKPSAHVSH